MPGFPDVVLYSANSFSSRFSAKCSKIT